MIEYKLKGKGYSSLTIEDYAKVSEAITSVFPGMPIDINKTKGFTRETRGINGEAFHTYYRSKDIRIFIPSKDKESIKERLEVLAELNFEKVKCQ